METPALGLSSAWRAVAIPVGSVCILLCALSGLLRAGWRNVLIATLVLGVVGALLYAVTPLLNAAGNWNLVVFFVVLLAASVFAGMPIAFTFGLATVAYILATYAAPVSVVVSRMDEGMGSLILLAVPLFVLLGQLMVLTNMATVIVDFLASLVGRLRGGLSYVLLGAVILVSGISGSKAADMAAVAPVLFPEMRRRGAEDGELISLLALARRLKTGRTVCACRTHRAEMNRVLAGVPVSHLPPAQADLLWPRDSPQKFQIGERTIVVGTCEL